MTLQVFKQNKLWIGSFVGLSLATFFMLGVNQVEAKSDVVSSPFHGILFYQATASHWTNYWFAGLGNVDVYVSYNADVFDATTGELFADGATVPLGTKLKFEPSRGTISWNGTGYTSDTPYGQWVANASRPGLTGTKIVSGNGWSYTFRTGACLAETWVDSPISPYNNLPTPVHIPFSVHPEAMTVDVSGSSAGLTPLGNNVFEVTSAGDIVAVFKYAATFGRFYYEYVSTTDIYSPGSCFTSWDLKPMSISGSWFGFNPTYNHPVPATSISYTLVAGDTHFENNPPETPVITDFGGNSHKTNDYQNFSIVADDSDNDALQYAIDWNMNGSVDQYVPTTGLVAPSVAQTAVRKWVTGGEYTFKVKAIDENGASSGWATHTIKICDDAYIWDGDSCELPLPDLVPMVVLSTDTVFDATSGLYNTVVIEYWARNIGGSTVTQNFKNVITLDLNNDGVAEYSTVDTITDNLAVGAESAHQIVHVADTIPAGDHVIKLSLDDPDDVHEISNDNNRAQLSLNPTAPTLTLRADDTFVRSGKATILRWTVDMLYLTDCIIVGPGVNRPINPSVVGGSGSLPSGSITAKSVYQFSCTVPSGEQYSTTATIETSGTIEEI